MDPKLRTAPLNTWPGGDPWQPHGRQSGRPTGAMKGHLQNPARKWKIQLNRRTLKNKGHPQVQSPFPSATVLVLGQVLDSSRAQCPPVPLCVCRAMGNMLQAKGLANQPTRSSRTAPLKGCSAGHLGHRLQTQREGREVREGALRPSPAQERAGGIPVFGR